MKKIICALGLTIVLVSTAISQTKQSTGLKISLDCADSGNFVSYSNSKNCSKLILSGADAENYAIVSSVISMNAGNILREFSLTGDKLIGELENSIKKIQKGGFFFIENARVKNLKTNIIVTLPTTKIVIK